MSKQIYIAWIDFQRRASSMNQYVDFDLHYIPPPFASKWLKPFGYIVQTVQTIRAVRAARPDMVWVQSPPGMVPHILLALRAVTRRFDLIVDCHNAAAMPPWSRFPGVTWSLNKCERVLVHNEEMRAVVEALGVRPSQIRVLEDPPAVLDQTKRATEAEAGQRPYVLVPCSFNADEHAPILEVLRAARQLPELDFKITGRLSKAEALGFVKDAPENVQFTDYLALEQFEALLIEAALVLGVTSRTDCQLSVANEALGAHSALVLSDTGILRKMFGDAALFAQNTADSFVTTLREALARRGELEARSEALKIDRQRSWLAEALRVSQVSGSGPDGPETPLMDVKPPAGR